MSKVDIETETQGAVDPAREFIFRTDSISLHGTDLYPDHELHVDNRDLAKLITPSLDQILTGYARSLTAATDPAVIRFMSRVTGKDTHKCFRAHLLLQRGIYERTIAEIRLQLVRYYPWHADLVDLLYGLYENPTTDKSFIGAAIEMTQKRADRFPVDPSGH